MLILSIHLPVVFEIFFIKRKSSFEKPQEAYRMWHNLFKYHPNFVQVPSVLTGGTLFQSWIAYLHWEGWGPLHLGLGPGWGNPPLWTDRHTRVKLLPALILCTREVIMKCQYLSSQWQRWSQNCHYQKIEDQPKALQETFTDLFLHRDMMIVIFLLVILGKFVKDIQTVGNKRQLKDIPSSRCLQKLA